MARGDGRVFLRGSVYWVGYSLRGQEFREPARDKDGHGITDSVAAEKFLRARMKEIHADELGARTFETPASRRLTVGDLLDSLKADYELRGKDSAQALSYIEQVRTDWGDKLALSVTPEKIDDYIQAKLDEEYRPASVNRRLQVIGAAFNLAIHRGTLARGPFVRKLSEADNVRTDFFSEAQLRTVIENLPQDLRDYVRFAAACGVRKGELSALRWEMLDGSTLNIPASICKNRKGRVLPLVGEMADIVERQKGRRRVEIGGVIQMCPYIFHRDGDCGPIKEFRKAWRTATRKAGCRGYLFHGLRRFAARALRDAGVPQVIAQTVTGHKTLSMWQRYALADEADMRKALAQVAEFRKTAAK